MKSQKDWLHTLHVTWLEYMTVFVVWMPPWGVPSSVGCCSLLNTTLLFSHFLNTSLSICTLLRSRFIWLKQPLMSPSSVHCGEQSLLKHLWSVSIASAVLLNFLNPYEFASASLSVIGSKAIRYSACMALFSMVGILKGLVLPFTLAILTLFSRRALYPLLFNEHIASIFLVSVSHFIWSTPTVRLPLLEVTFVTANALAS